MGISGRKMPSIRSTCATCGKPISPPKRAYCSTECQVEACHRARRDNTLKQRQEEMDSYVPESLDGEIWKPVVGFENEYKVSNYGRVRTNSLFRTSKDGRTYLVKARILKQYKQRGYLNVTLSKCGHYKKARVHRLVAAAFIPNPDNKPEVNHIDGNKQNNGVENLEWCTSAENSRHALEHGLSRLIDPETAAQVNRKPVVRDDGVVFESITDMAVDIGRVIGTARWYLNSGNIAPNGHRYRRMNDTEREDFKNALQEN